MLYPIDLLSISHQTDRQTGMRAERQAGRQSARGTGRALPSLIDKLVTWLSPLVTPLTTAAGDDTRHHVTISRTYKRHIADILCSFRSLQSCYRRSRAVISTVISHIWATGPLRYTRHAGHGGPGVDHGGIGPPGTVDVWILISHLVARISFLVGSFWEWQSQVTM